MAICHSDTQTETSALHHARGRRMWSRRSPMMRPITLRSCRFRVWCISRVKSRRSRIKRSRVVRFNHCVTDEPADHLGWEARTKEFGSTLQTALVCSLLFAIVLTNNCKVHADGPVWKKRMSLINATRERQEVKQQQGESHCNSRWHVIGKIDQFPLLVQTVSMLLLNKFRGSIA